MGSPDQPSLDAVSRAIELAERNAEETIVAIGRLIGVIAHARAKNDLHYNASADVMYDVGNVAETAGLLVRGLASVHKTLQELADKHGLGGVVPAGGGGGK